MLWVTKCKTSLNRNAFKDWQLRDECSIFRGRSDADALQNDQREPLKERALTRTAVHGNHVTTSLNTGLLQLSVPATKNNKKKKNI